ncbi:polysaccharide biosynthesis/export family protein [Mucilaginibacter galii]|uniref:Polysaccharide export outer membrane protein n=1 Tax=Mucilaginibacter galii TaxID=2005073 RepID=A0A917N231_9SPHI|nr:polysaccharide biosynthesis/export family protein [Mucilaginibacter galii]GGI51468.1 polysaccharide export outer membrane protein [Mucilaginibacter galii]
MQIIKKNILFLERFVFKIQLPLRLKNMRFSLKWCVCLYLPFIFTSCSSIKNVKYFKDIPDSAAVTRLADIKYTEPKILPDDILSINIQTVDPAATQTLTQGNVQNSAIGATSTGSTGGQTIAGYLVDNQGNVEMPVLGKIKISGLTSEQARNLIREKAAQYYKNPTVNLRFANFKITILGEVSKPGTYVVSNEKVNILDALGLAGDLTIYGKRENVVLIRQHDDGSRQLIRLDLSKSEVLNSPYYFLKQNDYLYVESSKSKIVASDAIQNRNISIITAITASLVSLLAIIISTK